MPRPLSIKKFPVFLRKIQLIDFSEVQTKSLKLIFEDSRNISKGKEKRQRILIRAGVLMDTFKRRNKLWSRIEADFDLGFREPQGLNSLCILDSFGQIFNKVSNQADDDGLGSFHLRSVYKTGIGGFLLESSPFICDNNNGDRAKSEKSKFYLNPPNNQFEYIKSNFSCQ